MDMMVNIVSPEAGVMPSGEAGNAAQGSTDGLFGQIFNAELGQMSADAPADGVSVPVANAPKSADEQDTQNAEISAAAAVIIAQLMQANAPDTPTPATEQVNPEVAQVAGGQQANPARVTIPIATDGAPQALEQAAQSVAGMAQQSAQGNAVPTESADSSVVIPVAAEANAEAVEIPLEGAAAETATAETGGRTTPGAVSSNADTADLDLMVRPNVRQALGNGAAAGLSREQAGSDQRVVNHSGHQTPNQPAQGQAAVDSQQVQSAVATAASVRPSANEVRTETGDRGVIRMEGVTSADASAVDSKVKGASPGSGDTQTGDNPGFNLGGHDQVRVSSTDAAQAARPEARTEAYSDFHQRVIDQVVREVKLHRFDQGGEVIVRLDPPELGTMHVKITHDAGIMTGHISASSDQVKGLLQAHLSTLVDSLSEAGVKMDSVSVSTGMPSGAFSQDGTNGNPQNQSNGFRRRFAGTGASAQVGSLNGTAGAFSANNNVGYSWLA